MTFANGPLIAACSQTLSTEGMKVDTASVSSKQQSLASFLFNGFVGFGEYAVPVSWLNRLAPTRNYHWTASIFLALLGMPVALLFTVWVAGRCLWRTAYYVVSIQWLRYWLGMLPER